MKVGASVANEEESAGREHSLLVEVVGHCSIRLLDVIPPPSKPWWLLKRVSIATPSDALIDFWLFDSRF